jgi:large subunit ribosomal protein L18
VSLVRSGNQYVVESKVLSRLSVYRSNENIYAQIIDDTNSTTLISCSTLDRSIKFALSTGRTCDASRLMGEKLAELSLKKKYKIVFDRGPYLYHGRIKALADGAKGQAVYNFKFKFVNKYKLNIFYE